MTVKARVRRAHGATRHQRPGGFTIVEMLITVVAIGVLVSLLVPAVQRVREASRRAACQHNARQIGLAMNHFADARRRYPPGQLLTAAVAGYRTISWCSFFLDYVDQSQIRCTWEAVPADADVREAPDSRLYLKARMGSVYNQKATATRVPLYLCPSASRTHQSRQGPCVADRNGDGVIDPTLYEGMACIDYAGNAGPNANHPRYLLPNGSRYPDDTGTILNRPVLSMDRGIAIKDVSDGLSKTMLLCELSGRGVSRASPTAVASAADNPRGVWAAGLNCITIGPESMTRALVNPPANDSASGAWYDDSNASLFSDHPGGAHVLMCDGGVKFLANSVANGVLLGLSSRNCAEIVGLDQP